MSKRFCKCGHSQENHSIRGGFRFCEGTTMKDCGCKGYEPEPPAKHTPGPWVAGRPDMGTIVDGVESKWIYSADDQYVAVASGRIKGEWNEVMANANLIAAAPDLLEAAKSTDQGYDWFRDELLAFRNYFGAQTVKQTEAFIDLLIAHLDSRQIGTRTAIARAEGGQS